MFEVSEFSRTRKNGGLFTVGSKKEERRESNFMLP